MESRPQRLPPIGRITSEDVRTTLRRRTSRAHSSSNPTPPQSTREAAEKILAEGGEEAVRSKSFEVRGRFLNALSSTVDRTMAEKLNEPLFFERICNVMLSMLQDEHQSIRAMAMRILRVCMFSERNLIHMLRVHVDVYVIRSLDLVASNEAERTSSFRLIYHMLSVYERRSNYKKLVEDNQRRDQKRYAFPKSIMQPVIAIALAALRPPPEKEKKKAAKGGYFEEDARANDKLALPCIALLMEFAVYEPDLTLEMAGTDWMVRVLTGEVVVSRRIATLVTRVFVHWLDSPKMRRKAQMNRVLESIFAPLVDFGFFNHQGEIVSEEAKCLIESTLETFQHTFLSILRSWSGLLACSAVGPGHTVISSSPLKLIEYLGLGNTLSPSLMRIRTMIVDLCCSFLEVPYFEKQFSTWAEATSFYSSMADPSAYDSSLRNDFVLAHSESRRGMEGRLLHHVDALSSFRAMSIFILVNANLPQSLVRLILACPNDPSSIKATLLLADLIGQASRVLPSEWRGLSLSLPTLLHSACESIALSKATAATHGLPIPQTGSDRFTYKNTKNSAIVLFRLDQIQTMATKAEAVARSLPSATSLLALFVPRKAAEERTRNKDIITIPVEDGEEWMHKMQLRSTLLNTGPISDDLVSSLLTSFTESTDGKVNWHVADALLERLTSGDAKAEDRLRSNERIHSFFDVILSWLHPSRGHLCRLSSSAAALPAAVGKAAVECLLRIDEPWYRDMLQSYADDCRLHLQKDKLSSGAFGSKYISFHGAMYYFTLLGALSSHSLGMACLERCGILQILLDMMVEATGAEYVKLIVASLDYSIPGLPRVILQKALTASSQQSRVWCTRFLEVLATLELPEFGDWGMRLMIGQMGDGSVKVVRNAVRLLHTWLPLYPSAVPLLRAIPLHTLGDAGILLRVHLFSNEEETKKEMETAREAVEVWMRSFNTRYTSTIEEEMREALMGIKRNIEGRFARTTMEKYPRYGVRMPVHLFAALASHPTGRGLLREAHVVKRLGELLKIPPSTDHRVSLVLKSAALALAQIGSAPGGMSLLPLESVVPIIRLSEESEVLSIRGAAFWALNILGHSQGGARVLARFGWESNRHSRVVQEVRAEKEQRSLSRSSHSGGFPEVETRPAAVSRVLSRRQTRVRSTLSENDRPSVEEETIETTKRRSRSAPSRSFYRGKRWRKVARCFSANPSVVCSPEEGEAVEGSSDESIGDDVPLNAFSNQLEVFGDSESTGQRSRRCTTVCSGALSPVLPSVDSSGRPPSDSIVEAIRFGLSATKKQIHDERAKIFASEWTRRVHFSSPLRTHWRLAPLLTRKCIDVSRNAGAPVSYYFLTQNELESLSEYRHVIEHDDYLLNELAKCRIAPHIGDYSTNHWTGYGDGRVPDSPKGILEVTTWTNVALPAEVEILCKGIFVEGNDAPAPTPIRRSNTRSYSFGGGGPSPIPGSRDDNRGQKGGYGRIRLDASARKHTAFCFYCNADPGDVHPFTVPNPQEWALLRLQVLELVDLLEIKSALPEKKLLTLRRQHPLLFDWPCLYADVLDILDEYRFKAQSRTFLQELFYNAFNLRHPMQE